MFAIFRLLSAVSAIIAFVQSPTGQRLVGHARSFIAQRLSKRGADQPPTLAAGG
jgi:hypothetical protein